MIPPLRRGPTLPKALSYGILASTLFGSCGGIRIPATIPPFQPEQIVRSQEEGIIVEAHPLQDYEAYWELFDEDLPKAGIAAVWVRIGSTRRDAVDLRGMQWKLRTGNRSVSPLDAREMLRQYYRGRGVRMYSTLSHQRSQRHLGRLTFKPGILARDGALEGFLFFRIDPASSRTWTREARLVAEGLRLPPKRKIRIELPLSNADS